MFRDVERRRVLSLLMAGGASVGLAALTGGFPRKAFAAAATRPRFYLQIIPSGGMDAVYTIDPKTTKEVARGIDIPYRASAIVAAGPVRLAPTFRPLERWGARLAVVNGFRQNSANHQSGLAHVTRCKSHTAPSMPTLLDILGSRRGDEAVGSMSIAADFATAFSPQYLGQPGKYFYGNNAGLFDHLDRAQPEDLQTAARVLLRQAESLGRHRLTAQDLTTAENLKMSSALLARAAVAPKFTPVPWKHALEAHLEGSTDLQRALWLLEHGMTRCVTVSVGRQNFDTHVDNPYQADMTSYLAMALDKVFEELDRRVVAGRRMSDQTLVVVGSEIGRFPRINTANGKDHFPQAPYLLFGAPVRPGAYGATDAEMIAMPVSLTTGRPQRGGHSLQIDDLGTTLLALDGVTPEVYGYTGRRLRFLEA
jgi:uncharacterized protein (DUF1501 family)